MLTRLASSAGIVSRLARTNISQQVRCMGAVPAKPLAEVCRENRTTINDLPVPAGSWQEYHSKQNSKWNMHLAASSVFFVVTLYAMYLGDVFILHDMPDYKKIEVDAYVKAEE